MLYPQTSVRSLRNAALHVTVYAHLFPTKGVQILVIEQGEHWKPVFLGQKWKSKNLVLWARIHKSVNHLILGWRVHKIGDEYQELVVPPNRCDRSPNLDSLDLYESRKPKVLYLTGWWVETKQEGGIRSRTAHFESEPYSWIGRRRKDIAPRPRRGKAQSSYNKSRRWTRLSCLPARVCFEGYW